MTPNWNKTAENEMTRARKALGAAHLLLKGGFLEDSASRSYYAVLHAAKAALAQQQCAPKTHQGTEHMFAKLMVKSGLIEPEYSGIFSEEQNKRELCDYTAHFEMVNLDADRVVADAARFVDRIERHLKERKTAKADEKAAMTVREGPARAYGALKRTRNAGRS